MIAFLFTDVCDISKNEFQWGRLYFIITHPYNIVPIMNMAMGVFFCHIYLSIYLSIY